MLQLHGAKWKKWWAKVFQDLLHIRHAPNVQDSTAQYSTVQHRLYGTVTFTFNGSPCMILPKRLLPSIITATCFGAHPLEETLSCALEWQRLASSTNLETESWPSEIRSCRHSGAFRLEITNTFDARRVLFMHTALA